MNEELLIKLVQRHKELYDFQDPLYDNQQKRENIWMEIGDIMEEPAETCKDRWRRIRDNYRRAKKLRKTKSGQAATKMKKARYEDLLSFLNPYISNKNETFSRRDSSGSSAGTSQSTLGNYSGSLEDSSPRPYKRISRSLDTPPQLSPTHSLLQEYLEKKYSAKRNKSDKIVDFFKNLGETVSNFPEDIQIRVKREVFKIVTDAEELVFRENSKPRYTQTQRKMEDVDSVLDVD